METNKLCEALEKKAVNDAYNDLRRLVNKFNVDLGLSTTNAYIVLKGDKEYSEHEINISVSKILDAIVKQLLEKRDQSIKDKAVSDFMKQFQSFSNHILTIEQYAQDMLE